MAIIQIRDVPDDVQAELTRRAARRGLSLAAYLRNGLVRQASTPDAEEVWASIGEQATATFSTQDLLDALDRGREGR